MPRKQEKTVKKGKPSLVAVLISEGDKRTLITPHIEYILGQGGLLSVREIGDYAGRVKEELLRIAEQAGTGAGVYTDREIRIQIKYGSPRIP